MKTSTLAAILERELLRTEEPTKTSDARECFACGRPFMPRPSTGDDNTHAFCSARCREACDAGFPAYGGGHRTDHLDCNGRRDRQRCRILERA
jgi:hypothetical protein